MATQHTVEMQEVILVRLADHLVPQVLYAYHRTRPRLSKLIRIARQKTVTSTQAENHRYLTGQASTFPPPVTKHHNRLEV